MNDRLELHNSKFKLGGLFVLFAAIGTLSLWMGVQKGEFMGIVGALFFGLACLGVVRQYFKRAFIIVDANGIQDSRLKWKFIPWEDIDSIWINRLRYYTALCIQFKHPEKYFRQMSDFESTIRKPDKWIGWGHISINTNGFSGNIYEIYDHIYKLRGSGKIWVNLRR